MVINNTRTPYYGSLRLATNEPRHELSGGYQCKNKRQTNMQTMKRFLSISTMILLTEKQSINTPKG